VSIFTGLEKLANVWTQTESSIHPVNYLLVIPRENFVPTIQLEIHVKAAFISHKGTSKKYDHGKFQ